VKTFDILQKQTIIQPKFYALKQILMKKLRLWNKLSFPNLFLAKVIASSRKTGTMYARMLSGLADDGAA